MSVETKNRLDELEAKEPARPAAVLGSIMYEQGVLRPLLSLNIRGGATRGDQGCAVGDSGTT